MAGDSAPEIASFPTRLVAGVALATLALLAWLSWILYGNYRLYADDGHRLLELSTARGTIIYLDEVFTMSASMAAVTGDTAWLDRYEALAPQSDEAIATAIKLARSPAVESAVRATEAANTSLIELEDEAFALIRAGDLKQAQAKLLGEDYRAQKQVYAEGMSRLERSLGAELDSIVSTRQRVAFNGVAAAVGVSLLIIVTWMIVLQRVRRWSGIVAASYAARVEAEAAVRKANEGLEATVAERTRALTRELAAREAAEKKLIEIQRMRAAGQLTGGVAHEFNNLLAVIKSNAEDLLGELKASPLLHLQADLIVRAADRGAGFVRQLLTFSRKQEMQPKRIDVNAFLDASFGLIRAALEANIAVEVRKAVAVPLINVDPVQLESAVLNIVGNARDAMPGGGAITIETAVVDMDAEYIAGVPDVVPGRYVRIAITDTGAGMPQSVLDSAFVPFFTTKEVGEGTGLGLSTVHGFVTQSGGYVHLYSEVGYGTTAKMYFPVAENIAAPAPAPSAGDGAGPPAARILVVEDDELVRQSVTRKLAALGCTVVAKESADDALTQLEADAGAVDLVFSDVIMPGKLTGADLAWEVQRRWPHIRVLLTSGYTETTTLGKVKIPPGLQVLTKPYANADLAKALHATMAGAKADALST